MVVTAIVMFLFEVVKMLLVPGITLWQSHFYTIVFTCVVAPLAALVILLKFEELYGKVALENEERKRAEVELSRLASIVTSSDDAIIGKTLDGIITSWNKAAERLYGYSESEAVGRSIGIIMPPDREQELRDIMTMIRRGGRVEHMETERVTKDGRRLDVSITISPILDASGNVVGASTIARDISAQKRANEALKYAEEFNRSTLDSLPINIAVLDESGTIVFVNRRWMQFGRENDAHPAESIDVGVNYFRVCREAKSPHSEEAPAALEGMRAVLTGERDSFEMEYPCHSPDKKRWFTMRVSRVRAGTFHGIIVTHTNITRRKLSEEALAEEKARVELYNDLMGHDINNYNQVALGYLELISRLMEKGELKDLLSKSIDAIASSSLLISNLQKLQKVKTEILKHEAMDLNQILSEMKTQYSIVPGKTVTIHYIPRPPCLVQANGLVRDVFTNLIWNAIKHSNKEAVNIGLELNRRREGDRTYCQATVEDDGPGIPDSLKDRIFARHQRGNTEARGSGLGLYLVKMLVETYKGRVWVEDRVQGDHTKGARFVVMLPTFEMER
jgi:PAS domain S-box-containing protein